MTDPHTHHDYNSNSNSIVTLPAEKEGDECDEHSNDVGVVVAAETND